MFMSRLQSYAEPLLQILARDTRFEPVPLGRPLHSLLIIDNTPTVSHRAASASQGRKMHAVLKL